MLSPLNSQPLQFSLLQQMLNTFRYLAFWLFCWECRFIQSHAILSGSKNSCPTYHFVLYFRSKTKSFNSVQVSRSVVSDSLRPHESQHARPPCSSPTPRVYPSPCPLSQRCHSTISSSVMPFFSCLQSFPGSGSFPMSQFFASGDKALELQLQDLFFQWIFRTDIL